MNVSLTPKLQDFVRRKVASGLYNNASEVVREALRLLVAREADASGPVAAAAPEKPAVRAALAALQPALRGRGVTSLALFGSLVRGTARADSDIDVLIDVDPEARFSLVDLVAVGNFLSGELGRRVDVVTRDGIEPALRARVLDEAERVF